MKKRSFKELSTQERKLIQDLNYNQKQTITNISNTLSISECAVKHVLNEFPEKIYFKVKPINVDNLIEKVPMNAFVSYYSAHSKKETLTHFSLTAQEFKTLLNSYNFKKDKADIYEIRKRTNIEKYGVDNPFKDTEHIKQSMLNKHGVEYNSQIKGFKEKRNNTIIQKYGSKKAFEEMQLKKREQTNLNKYGYKIKLADPNVVKQVREKQYQKYGSKENYNQHVKEKQQCTIIDKYGSKEKFLEYTKQRRAESILDKYGSKEEFNEYVNEQTIKAHLNKYGYTSSFCVPEILNKCKQTTLQKYGVDNVFKSKEWQENIHKKKEMNH